jgi:hypothetical protein
MNSTAAAALVENILLGCINATNVRRILCPDCHEIVMVARSERITSRQNGSNRSICNPLKRGVE